MGHSWQQQRPIPQVSSRPRTRLGPQQLKYQQHQAHLYSGASCSASQVAAEHWVYDAFTASMKVIFDPVYGAKLAATGPPTLLFTRLSEELRAET
eukprot:scaffold2660_cov257-Pinguiococcus_pyrenoidosus.AAC.3